MCVRLFALHIGATDFRNNTFDIRRLFIAFRDDYSIDNETKCEALILQPLSLDLSFSRSPH